MPMKGHRTITKAPTAKHKEGLCPMQSMIPWCTNQITPIKSEREQKSEAVRGCGELDIQAMDLLCEATNLRGGFEADTSEGDSMIPVRSFCWFEIISEIRHAFWIETKWKRKQHRLLAHIYAMESSSPFAFFREDCRFGTKPLAKSRDKHRRRTQGERVWARREREIPPPNCIRARRRRRLSRRLRRARFKQKIVSFNLDGRAQRVRRMESIVWASYLQTTDQLLFKRYLCSDRMLIYVNILVIKNSWKLQKLHPTFFLPFLQTKFVVHRLHTKIGYLSKSKDIFCSKILPI